MPNRRAGSRYRHQVRRVLFVFVLVAALAGFAGPAEAKRSVPSGFFGTMLDGPLNSAELRLGGETAAMSRNGVESVRFAARWKVAQPYPTFAQVPAGQSSRYRDEGGVPTDWIAIDRKVGAAARRGLRSMPVITQTPVWGRVYSDRSGSPPQPKAFARFAKVLVRRYGPKGRFWSENPRIRRVPVRYWQILNEVNYGFDVPGSDPDNIDNFSSAPGYVKLLRVTRPAIKGVDPGARIVHAGIFSRAWLYAAAVYRAGGRRLFDLFAVHPYTASPENVLLILRYVRREMNRAGDGRKPMLVSEWSFPSSKGRALDPDNYGRTTSGQARAVGQTHKIFVRWRKRLRLNSVYHYNWLSSHTNGNRFTFAGLRFVRGGRVFRKPALNAYARSALAYEGCRRKSSRSATRCLRRRR